MAFDPFESPYWYRIAPLCPKLRRHVKISRHLYRGEPWYLLQNSASDRHHRLNAMAYQVVGLMDGCLTMQQIWELLNAKKLEEPPVQEEIIQLLSTLYNDDIIQCDLEPDGLELFNRYEKQRRLTFRRRFQNPLALRFPLFDPERMLSRGMPILSPLFSLFGMIVWLAMVFSAVGLGLMSWDQLAQHSVELTENPLNLLLLVIAYPLLKTLHELAHGFALKRWGGEVHEMGIMLLVFMPIPYVDASAASAFREKRQRMLVGAAGILSDLFLAAIGLWVWHLAEPGTIRSFALVVFLTGGISSLFFNGNPLLRFDAYYVLSDALEIPNLATRSNRYLGYLIKRYLFGFLQTKSPAASKNDRVWLLGYGVGAFLYRIFILVVIALMLGERFEFLGVLLIIWVAMAQVVLPAFKNLRTLFTDPEIKYKKHKVILVFSCIFGIISLLLFIVPMPLSTRAEGVVWVPEQSQIRVKTDCFVEQVFLQSGTRVTVGDHLISCEAPFIRAEREILEAQITELQIRLNNEGQDDRVQGQILQEELLTVRAELADVLEQEQQMVVRSPVSGTLSYRDHDHLIGQFLQKGRMIAYVIPKDVKRVRTVVAEDEVGLIRKRVENIQIKPSSVPDITLQARVTNVVPSASITLPSPVLGSKGGGRFHATDMDEQGLQTVEPIFELELRSLSPLPVSRLGERVYIRFDHGSEAIVYRWLRDLRRLFLRRFDV